MATKRDFLKLLAALEVDIDNLVSSLDKETQTTLSQFIRGDDIVDVVTFHKKFRKVLTQRLDAIFDRVINASKDVAKVRAELEYEQIETVLQSSRGSKRASNLLMSKFFSEVQQYPDKLAKRMWTRRAFDDGQNLIYRYATMKSSAVKTVNNIIQVGLDKGYGASRIARDISSYVYPTERERLAFGPKEIYRQRFGIDRKDINVRGGSVKFNAQRIARTETMRTYRGVPEELNRGKPWVRGYKWTLSSAHTIADADVCDDWAKANDDGLGAGIYKSGNLPNGHPNDLCQVITVLKTEKELANILNAEDQTMNLEGTGDVINIEDAKLTPEATKYVNESVAKLRKDGIKVDSVLFRDFGSDDNAMARVVMKNGVDNIELNTRIINGDLSELKEVLLDANNRRFLRHQDLGDVLIHESAHIKFPVRVTEDLAVDADFNIALAKYAGTAGYDSGKWLKYQSDTFVEKVENEISRYAMSSTSEFIAEVYAYAKQGKLSGDAKEFGDYILSLAK